MRKLAILMAVTCGLLHSCGDGPSPSGPVEGTAADPGRASRPAAIPAAAIEAAEPIVFMWQVQQSGPRGDFAALRSLGVNTVQSSRLATWPDAEVREYLDGAAREGLKVIVYLGIFRSGSGPDCTYAPAAFRFIDAYKAHPALFAWHSLDEPAGNRITPDCQRALYKAIKQHDPDHRVMLSANNDDDSDYDDYFAEDAFDIYEVHKYVNPHPAADQRRLVELLRTRRTREYPVIITLRAFNAPHKPLRLPMSSGSFDEQYQYFIAQPLLTQNVGFYGWDLAPNQGIRNDPGMRAEFTEFMGRRIREPGQRLR